VASLLSAVRSKSTFMSGAIICPITCLPPSSASLSEFATGTASSISVACLMAALITGSTRSSCASTGRSLRTLSRTAPSGWYAARFSCHDATFVGLTLLIVVLECDIMHRRTSSFEPRASSLEPCALSRIEHSKITK
jgi:hypothetical protein